MGPTMISLDIRSQIAGLLSSYAYLLDEDKLEDWVECFTDPCRYKVTTRENIDAGLPAGIVDCDSKDMLRDRVMYIRKAAVANFHRDRHFLGQSHVAEVAPGQYDVVTNFIVYQSEPDRESRVFCLGCYESKVVSVDGHLRLNEQLVVLDNDSITPLLSTPI
jgi:anthranilate 1,2-dioxygenase small subunit